MIAPVSSRLELAHLVGASSRLDAGRAQALEPRRLGRPGRRVRVHDQRALAPDPRALAEPLLELVEQRQPEHARGRARARRPCRSTARCPRRGPVVPPDDRAAVEQRDADAAPRQLAAPSRRRRCPAPTTTTSPSPSAKPAGNGSSGSSRYWPIPVIHARPVISGTTAGRPADRRLLDDAAGEARADHRLVDERVADGELAARVQLGEPRRGAGPARRAVEPAGMDRRRGARVGAVAPGRVEDHVAAAGDPRRPRDGPGGRSR